ACSEAAITSGAAHLGASDIGWHWTIDEQGGVPPWEDLGRYVDRSPVTYAPSIHTPLLIVHGESDLRCSIVESEQLFVALKRLGREAVFVRMPDAAMASAFSVARASGSSASGSFSTGSQSTCGPAPD